MASGYIKMYCTEADMEGRVYWQNTGNISTNSSTLTLKYQVRYIGENQSKNVSYDVSFHGIYEENTEETTYLPEVSRAFDNKEITKGTWYDVYTTSVGNIEHDNTGNARLLINVRLYDRIQYKNTIYTQTGNTSGEYSTIATLGTITRWAYITSATNFNEDENPTITYTNPAGATNIQACISFTGATDDIAYRPVSGGRYTFELTAAEREKLINAVTKGSSRTVYFYLKSYKDGVVFRKYVARTFSLTDALPNITPGIYNMNSEQHELTGSPNALIRYASMAAVQSNAVAKYNGTIASEKIINGNNVEEDGLAAFENIETNLFTFEATDNRGNKATLEYVAEPWVEYFLPTCNQKVQIEFDTDTETEAKVKLEISGTWFNSSFGAMDNEITVQFRHKLSNEEWTGEEWISAADVIWETTTNENTYKVKGTVSGLAYDESHTFQCRVIDKLSTTETSEYTVTLIPLFEWGKRDFTFNVPVEINGDLTVSGAITVGGNSESGGDSVIERGEEAMGSNGTWYWEKWSSGKAVCWGVRNFGNMAINKAWGSMYESASFTQDFPTGLFIEIPYFIIHSVRAGGAVFVEQGWNTTTPPTATNTGTFCCYRPTSMTVPQVHLGFYAIGRWQ